MTNKTHKFFPLLFIFCSLFCGMIFAAEGDVIWTRTYNGPADGSDEGWGIAVDESGNVYVTGYEAVTGESYNIWVRKYDTNGEEVWTRTHNDADNGWDQGCAVAVDGSGNVYVTGYEAVTGENRNIWIRKYDSGGNEVWTSTYNDISDWDDEGHSITVDGSSNVYVTGQVTVTDEGFNIWVRKYDSDGNEFWTRTYNGPADGSDAGRGIVVDRNGNVYVTGWETVTGESYNIWVRKYDWRGNEVWTRTHNGPANLTDAGWGIVVDGSGNVYVTGCEVVTGESNNIWVRKYDADGNEVWTRTYNGTANQPDYGYGIAVDGSGNIYVTGREYVIDQWYNIWVRKYKGAFGEHFEPPAKGEVKIQGGEKGYVNPQKGEVAKIHFKPSAAGTVNVKIFTLRGLLVWEKSKEVSGLQDFIEWNCRNTENIVVAAGIYIVYVEGPGIKATKKAAILK